jgi:hypothetical protein
MVMQSFLFYNVMDNPECEIYAITWLAYKGGKSKVPDPQSAGKRKGWPDPAPQEQEELPEADGLCSARRPHKEKAQKVIRTF